MLRREGHLSKANTVRMHSTTREARVLFEQERWGRYGCCSFSSRRSMNRCHPTSRPWEEQEPYTRRKGHPSQNKHSVHKGPAPGSWAGCKITDLSPAMQAVPGRCLHPRMRARFKLFPPKVQTRALQGKPNRGHGGRVTSGVFNF